MNLINLNNKKYNFLITGGTGFIGTKLCNELLKDSQSITVLTRKIQASFSDSKIKYIQNLNEVDFDFDAIINLCGEPISCRWSATKKQKIFNSRINITKELSEKILAAKTPPKLFISGSAVGYYGTSATEIFDEKSSANPQDLFSQKICQAWEEAAKPAAQKTRLVLLRTGIVVGKNGGFLSKMLLPFKLGLGGKIATGNQYLSWIHLDDVIGIINHVINDQTIFGSLNLSAPNVATNEEFSKTLAKILHRPCLCSVPAFLLKLIYGEMAEELLLAGQKVLPKKISQAGYKFYYPQLEQALKQAVL